MEINKAEKNNILLCLKTASTHTHTHIFCTVYDCHTHFLLYCQL